MNTKFKVEVINEDSGETIYIREFPTQIMLEEHLREMAKEVEIYNEAQQEEITKHREAPDYPEEGDEEDL